MITCHRRHLQDRCRERGYSLAEVMPCVVAQDGDTWTIDTSHAAYPATPKPGHERPAVWPEVGRGPGTELKKRLAMVGIRAEPGCSCNARANEMDGRGPQWCRENIDLIVGWLRDEASIRGLPFLDGAGQLIVKLAIRAAERASPNEPVLTGTRGNPQS